MLSTLATAGAARMQSHYCAVTTWHFQVLPTSTYFVIKAATKTNPPSAIRRDAKLATGTR